MTLSLSPTLRAEHGFEQESDGDAQGPGQGRRDCAKVSAGVHGGQADVLPRDPGAEYPHEGARQAQSQGRGERWTASSVRCDARSEDEGGGGGGRSRYNPPNINKYT